ncbi:MAG: hypothetical protein CMI60_07705 [Parvibaculum sp.]|nr:hypothetical protein [Parvibaculum sp.]
MKWKHFTTQKRDKMRLQNGPICKQESPGVLTPDLVDSWGRNAQVCRRFWGNVGVPAETAVTPTIPRNKAIALK